MSSNDAKHSVLEERAPASSTSIRLVSFNVLASEFTNYNTLNSNIESQEQKLVRWQNTAAVLSMTHADVIALQEATVDFVEFLYDELEGFGYRALNMKRAASKPDGAAIFYNTAVFSSAVKTVLPFQNQGKSPRAALLATLSMNDGRTLVVGSLHLEGAPRCGNIRAAQLSETVEAACELAAAGGWEGVPSAPIVLMGDMNHDVKKVDELLSVLPPSMTRVALPAVTAWCNNHYSSIDHVFASTNGESGSVRVVGADVLPPSRALLSPPYIDDWPSDHFLILLDVELG